MCDFIKAQGLRPVDIVCVSTIYIGMLQKFVVTFTSKRLDKSDSGSLKVTQVFKDILSY